MEKKTSTADFKFKVVMESFQRETTLEATCQKFGVSRSQLMRWRHESRRKAPACLPTSAIRHKKQPARVTSQENRPMI